MSNTTDIDFNPARLDPAAFSAWQDASRGIEQRTIAFIAGPQRTGTTWLVRCLHSHPSATALCEGNGVNKLVGELLHALRRFNEAIPDHTPYCRLTETDLTMMARQAIDRQLLHYLASDSKDPACVEAIVDKTPAHAEHLDALDALYPWAKFILCVRDPRDAAVSSWKLFQRMGWRQGESVEQGALHYAENVWAPMVRAGRAAGARIGPERFIETSFEDRIADPESEMRRVLAFLGVRHDPNIIRTCLDGGTLERATEDWLRRVNPSGDISMEPKYQRGAAGNWRNYLAPDVADEVLRLAMEGAGAAAQSAA